MATKYFCDRCDKQTGWDAKSENGPDHDRLFRVTLPGTHGSVAHSVEICARCLLMLHESVKPQAKQKMSA